jgi:hypothetical protein
MKLSRHVYATQNEKVIDFALGFIGWFILNGLMAFAGQIGGGLSTVLVAVLPFDPNLMSQIQGVVLVLLACLPLLVNIAGLVLLAFTRHWIALGALAAFATSLVVVLCAAILFLGACFIMTSALGA